jgi:hypothetical protein
MKQYRITSENFVSPGETGDADAFMAPDDLAELKKLAGVGSLGLLENYAGNAEAREEEMSSPMGGKDSMPSAEKRQLERDNHIKVGSPEWFQLWFSKPFLTGEKPVGDAPASKVQRDKDSK